MAEIPQELIYEILLLSPVRSLLRFRCLSKSLCAVIDSLDFINSHLAASSKYIIHRKLIFQDRSTRFHVCDMQDGHEEKVQLKPLQLEGDQVCGYCNGLLLLKRSSFGVLKLALWNPSTSQCNYISDSYFSGQFIGSGLGYDTIEGYKVVLIYNTYGGNQVWCFGARSYTWRRIEGFPCNKDEFDNFVYKSSNGIFADGAIYWLNRINSYQKVLLAFDVRKETFSLDVTALPNCSIPTSLVITDLHVLEQCLCISFFCSFFLYTRAELYIRRNNGVGHFTWTQIYSISECVIVNTLRFKSLKVLGYLKRRDKILLDFGMEDVFAYDLKTKSIEKVGMKLNPGLHDPILCIESLASVCCGD